MSCFILGLEQFSGLQARGFVGTVEGGGEEIREVIVCTGISVAHLDELSLSSGRRTATPTELDGWNFLSGGVVWCFISSCPVLSLFPRCPALSLSLWARQREQIRGQQETWL